MGIPDAGEDGLQGGDVGGVVPHHQRRHHRPDHAAHGAGARHRGRGPDALSLAEPSLTHLGANKSRVILLLRCYLRTFVLRVVAKG